MGANGKVIWKKDGLAFKAIAGSGYTIDLKSDSDLEKSGGGPMELIAVGLAGCTAMDVISILKKKRQDVIDFEVRVDTRSADTYPKVWTYVQVEYIVTGNNIDPEAVERAIELSTEKYCPAHNLISKAVDIETTYQILEAQVN